MIIDYSTATSGSVTITNTQQDVCFIHDAGATLTLTILFPATPNNGQIFSIASAGGITTLTLSAAVGAIQNALATLSGGGNATYVYVSAPNKWFKIK